MEMQDKSLIFYVVMVNKMTPEEEQYKQQMIELCEHMVELHGPSKASKIEREKSVAVAFLRSIGMTLQKSDLMVPREDPPDISYNNACFEITEVIASGRRRGDEWKKCLEKYRNARTLHDMTIPYKPRKIVCLSDVFDAVKEALQKKASNYSICPNLDALVYITYLGESLDVTSPIPDCRELISQGWRSVSLFFDPVGVVLFANSSAPSFLSERQGQYFHEWNGPFHLGQYL